jgi:hypothetical protein
VNEYAAFSEICYQSWICICITVGV